MKNGSIDAIGTKIAWIFTKNSTNRAHWNQKA